LPIDADFVDRVLPMMPDIGTPLYERERPIALRPVESSAISGRHFPTESSCLDPHHRAAAAGAAIHQCANWPMLPTDAASMLRDSPRRPCSKRHHGREASIIARVHRRFAPYECLLLCPTSERVGRALLLLGLIFTPTACWSPRSLGRPGCASGTRRPLSNRLESPALRPYDASPAFG